MKLIKRRNHNASLPTFFDDFFTRDVFGLEKDFTSFRSHPAVNVIENDEAFRIEVAAPGLKKDDFKIELDNEILTISFEKKETEEVNDGNEKFTRKEFTYSSFKRSFTIPEATVDGEKIKADYDNGILKLNLPKREEAKVKAKRTIEVK